MCCFLFLLFSFFQGKIYYESCWYFQFKFRGPRLSINFIIIICVSVLEILILNYNYILALWLYLVVDNTLVITTTILTTLSPSSVGDNGLTFY